MTALSKTATPNARSKSVHQVAAPQPGASQDERPVPSWSFTRLMKFAAGTAAQSDRLETESEGLFEQARALSHDSAVQAHRLGEALTIARKKLPAGKSWTEMLKSFGIAKTTAWEAMKLFTLAPLEDQLKGLTRTEAKINFGIVKPKKKSSRRLHTKAESDESDDRDAETEAATDEDAYGGANDDADGGETDADEEDVDADEEDVDADEEDVDADDESADDEDDPSEADDEEEQADDDADQPDETTPLEAMDEAITWLAAVESAIDGVHLDDESLDAFQLKLQEAEQRLGRIHEAVELQAAED